MDTATIIAVIGGVASFIAALGGVYIGFRRINLDQQKMVKNIEISKQEISHKAVHAAAEILDDYREEVDRLRKRIEDLELVREKDKYRIKELQLQVSQMSERITALESENEFLIEENEKLRGCLGNE